MYDDPNPSGDWPPYSNLPRDAVHAIGMVSIHYAWLENAMAYLFMMVAGTSQEFNNVLIPKIRDPVRLRLMREMLVQRAWPEEAVSHVTCFIEGYEVLSENRSSLMHSYLSGHVADDSITPIKTNRSGESILAEISLTELRDIADDMYDFYWYGFQLGHVVVANLLGLAEKFGLSPDERPTWPEKPRAPRKLHYKPWPSHQTDEPPPQSSPG